MIKKIFNILLSIVLIISLFIGIAYSLCPVIPNANYIIYNSEGENIVIKNRRPINGNKVLIGDKSYSYIKFDLFGKGYVKTSYKVFTVYDNYEIGGTYTDDILQAYSLYSNVSNKLVLTTVVEHETSISVLSISKNKTCLTSKDGDFIKTPFNPTFIFYVVSATALISLFSINYKTIKLKLKAYYKNNKKDGE